MKLSSRLKENYKIEVCEEIDSNLLHHRGRNASTYPYPHSLYHSVALLRCSPSSSGLIGEGENARLILIKHGCRGGVQRGISISGS